MKRIYVLGVLCLLLSQFGYSQQTDLCNCIDGRDPVTGRLCVNTILTAVPFLRIAPDARSGAMGDVGIALSADANSMHFNESKLVFADNPMSVSATYTPWLRSLGLNDVYMAYLSGYKKFGDFQAMGLSLRYFSLGSIQFTDDQGNFLKVGNPNEMEVKLAYSRKLTDDLAVGFGGKFIYSNLANNQVVEGQQINAGIAVAGDFSVTYNKPLRISGKRSDLTMAAAISNIGTKISYTNSTFRDYIPANLGLGAAWKFNLDAFNTITFATDINKLLVPSPNSCLDDNQNKIPDYKEQSVISSILNSFSDAPQGLKEEVRELMYSFGVEYWYADQFAVRAGYYNEHYTKGNRKFFTVGLGVKYNVFGLNLSYLVPTTNRRNPLDNTLRFSLLFDIGSGEELEEPTSN